MHIPDNYLGPATCAVMALAAAPALIVSAKKVAHRLPKEKIPLLGIGAAFSFLIMMFNVPVPGGTTAHAVGGTLLAALLGPYAACLSISTALLIQALMFGDGGILAFGANTFNMAVVIPFVGYFIYRFVKDRVSSKRGEYAGLAIAAYVAINAAALCAAIEFGLQPLLAKDAAGVPLYCPYPLAVSIPAMLIPHLAVAGLVEAAFTVAIFAFVERTSPGTVYAGSSVKLKPLYVLLAGLVLASPLGLLAAGTAWGEWGADEIKAAVNGGSALGFTPAGMAQGLRFDAPLRDYAVKGAPEIVGYALSAIIGVAAVIIAFKLLALLKKDRGGPSRAEA
ncbi:MAG: cobalt transporter CbiM [Treponema sp.]|nr:cobalt transporter CbiM [Treponema sp.]